MDTYRVQSSGDHDGIIRLFNRGDNGVSKNGQSQDINTSLERRRINEQLLKGLERVVVCPATTFVGAHIFFARFDLHGRQSCFFEVPVLCLVIVNGNFLDVLRFLIIVTTKGTDFFD